MGNLPDFATFMSTLAVWGLPVLFAITFHEAAHGFVARLYGDNTAWALGRVTLNPLRHIDPFGTVLMPLVLLAVGAPMLGYAKPVPVNFLRLKPYKSGSIAVALAGPGTNLVLAVLSVLLMYGAVFLPGMGAIWAIKTLWASVQFNILIMCFNLLPLLPLDGGRVLAVLLPPDLAIKYGATERYGMVLLLLLLFTGLLFKILMPLMMFVLQLVVPLMPDVVVASLMAGM